MLKLKCISAPEAADRKVKMVWRQTSPVTPCFGEETVANIQRLATNKNMIIMET